ncbi:MAG TPA: NUDIX hydrolase [Pirellulales bacterium]
MKNKITGVRRITSDPAGNPLRWLNQFEAEFQTSDGRRGTWAFASRREQPVLGPGPLAADAVVIVPLWKSPGETRLVVVREFRIPLGDYEYGFPAGLRDGDEPVAETAARELREETGLELTRVLRTSPAIASSAGLTDEAVRMLIVECRGTPSADHCEGVEDIEVHLMDQQAVLQLASSDEKISGKAWPIMLMFGLVGFNIDGLAG